MNNYRHLFLEKLSFYLLKVANSTIFNRLVMLAIALISMVIFIVVYLQTKSGYWIILLFLLAIVNMILSFSKKLKVVEFVNFISITLLIGLFFIVLMLLGFWFLLF